VLHLEQLSSGEKQLLLILLKVFLLDKKPAIIFMDELEISLHIRWQREIIDRMRQINPFCQIIIATHSPSMFGTGWGDKVVYMEDIIK
jgi:predicted ATP-binding protein involved in virulence